MKRYVSHNIDEAAYLTLQGYLPRVVRTGAVSATFTFQIDRNAEAARTAFWKGEALVQLARWLTVRQALKNETLKQLIPIRLESAGRTTDKPLPIATGTPYYYREGAGVLHSMFGISPAHLARLTEGNVYRTREDAMMKRNPLTV